MNTQQVCDRLIRQGYRHVRLSATEGVFVPPGVILSLFECGITADPCPDANGFTTLRFADDSEHGNTDEQPVATAYDARHAAEIVTAINNHESLLSALRELTLRTRQFIAGNLVTFPAALLPQCEAAIRAAGAEPLDASE